MYLSGFISRFQTPRTAVHVARRRPAGIYIRTLRGTAEQHSQQEQPREAEEEADYAWPGPVFSHGVSSFSGSTASTAAAETFFASLWRMISADERAQRATAEEIRASKEEQLTQLGPALDNVQGEFLAPSVDRAFSIGSRRRMFPPPPRELHGVELRVEFISIIAQAQKLMGLGSVQRLVSSVDALARMQIGAGRKPTVLDKLDLDQAVDVVADGLGTPPSLVRADEVVARMREDEEKREAQQQQMAQAAAAAETAKTLGSTPMDGDTALTRLAGGLSPLAAAGQGGA